jgi:hypothetical protein
MEERETSERKMESLQKKLQELFASLSVTLGGDYGLSNTAAFDKMISRVRIEIWFDKVILSIDLKRALNYFS